MHVDFVTLLSCFEGDLLRAFGFLGFNLLRPDDPTLPPWEDAIFMVYPMDRSLCLEEE